MQEEEEEKPLRLRLDSCVPDFLHSSDGFGGSTALLPLRLALSFGSLPEQVASWYHWVARRRLLPTGDLPMRFAALTVCLVLFVGPLAGQEKDKDFVPLFDGKTLDGWSGNLKAFRVEDGCIVGGTLKERIPQNEFLTHKSEFAYFELRLKFKAIGKGVNGGVQIRSRRIPNHHEMIGYQADIGEGYWGSLYDESRRNKVLAKPDPAEVAKILKRDDWNDYVIRCEGKRIRLRLNGVLTCDYTEADAKLEQTGLIGLQIHGGGPSEVWYKDLRIKVSK
jgi:hypothetical protein